MRYGLQACCCALQAGLVLCIGNGCVPQQQSTSPGSARMLLVRDTPFALDTTAASAAAAACLQTCAGLFYCFSLYSPAVKAAFDFDQAQIQVGRPREQPLVLQCSMFCIEPVGGDADDSLQHSGRQQLSLHSAASISCQYCCLQELDLAGQACDAVCKGFCSAALMPGACCCACAMACCCLFICAMACCRAQGVGAARMAGAYFALPGGCLWEQP